MINCRIFIRERSISSLYATVVFLILFPSDYVSYFFATEIELFDFIIFNFWLNVKLHCSCKGWHKAMTRQTGFCNQ